MIKYVDEKKLHATFLILHEFKLDFVFSNFYNCSKISFTHSYANIFVYVCLRAPIYMHLGAIYFLDHISMYFSVSQGKRYRC